MTTDRKSSSKAKSQDDGDKPEPEAVQVVARYADGSPVPEGDFILRVAEGSSDADKAAAWNNGGEMPPESRIRYFKLPV